MVLGRAYAKGAGLSLSTVGLKAVGSSSFFERVNAKHPIMPSTYDRFVMFCADNWPPGTVWPKRVKRPRRKREA